MTTAPIPHQTPAGILIPCSASEFGSFISDLLGKPQIIRGSHDGSFSIGFDEIENFYHLIIQRIQEQNQGTLIQLSIRIAYDDGTSVELNGIEQFRSYSETRPLIATKVILTFIFIISFPGGKHPEKQQIDIAISVRNGESDDDSRQVVATFDSGIQKIRVVSASFSGRISFRIQHTRRSWGVDIESLIQNHILSILKNDRDRMAELFSKWANFIGFSLFFITFIALSIVGIQIAEKSRQITINRYTSLIHSSADGNLFLPDRIDFLVNQILSGSNLYWAFGASIYAIFIFIFSIVIAVSIASVADEIKPSFLLLTRRSETNKKALMEKFDRRNLKFFGFCALNIILSVFGNIAFYYIW